MLCVCIEKDGESDIQHCHDSGGNKMNGLNCDRYIYTGECELMEAAITTI